MKRGSSTLIFVAFLAVAGVFVLSTSSALPARVASHFGASGQANSFMSRDGYVAFMLVFVVGLPLVMTGFMALVFRSDSASMNLPNRDYWVAPERRAQLVALLTAHGMRFGAGLVVFLSYVHWLVVRANTQRPPQLDNDLMYAGLALFLLATVLWIVWLWLTLRRAQTR